MLALARRETAAAELWRQVQIDAVGALANSERAYYTALIRLAEGGFIERDETGARPWYRLRPRGRQTLKAEQIRLANALSCLRARI